MTEPTASMRLLAHALAKPGAWVDHPWEGDTVAKVGPVSYTHLDVYKRQIPTST